LKDKQSSGRVGAPIKIALNFFPISAQNDDLIDELEFKFGHIGVTFFIRLQKLIYGEKGFYYELNTDDDQDWVFTLRKLHFESKDRHKLRGILQFLIDKDFFDANFLREKKILTSNRIQLFYFWATKRRLLADFNKEYYLPGVEKFISEVRKMDVDKADEIEELAEDEDGVYKALNGIVQKANEGENVIPVHNNPDNGNIIPIDVNTIQTKETKREEKKAEGSFEKFHFSILYPIVSSDTGPEQSSDGKPKPKKKAKLMDNPFYKENREVLIKKWQEFSKMVYAPGDETNAAVMYIFLKTLKNAIFELDKREIPEEKRSDSLVAEFMHWMWDHVLNQDRWDKMPPTLNSHKGLPTIHRRWEDLYAWAPRAPKQANSKKGQKQGSEKRSGGQRSQGMQNISKLVQGMNLPPSPHDS
jgi:hypothetical protein